MNWKEIKNGELSEIFTILEQAFNDAGVDFYLIGAIAKQYWYSKKRTYGQDYEGY